MEIWKPIPSTDGFYEASSLGRIRSLDRYVGHRSGRALKKGKVLRPQVDKDGYLQVGAWHKDKGRPVTRKVHRLVAEAFIPGAGDINHKDLDVKNNRPENLEWVTKLENQRHAIEHGRRNPINNPNCRRKMTPEMVNQLRAARDAGATYSQLAARFNITPSGAHHIYHRKLWNY